MNIRYLLLPLAACSALALAEEPPVERYTYGMSLDIDEVVALNEPTELCGVISEQMRYEDSQDAPHVLEYLKYGTGCSYSEGGI